MNGTNLRHIIKVCAAVVCVMFFTLPLVQCTQYSELSATGWQMASGTGEMMGRSGGGNLFVFMLLIIPVVLLIVAFTGASFTVLRNIAIIGLITKIIFIIVVYVEINSGEFKGAFSLTMYSWLILAMYIGLCVLPLYGEELEELEIKKERICPYFDPYSKCCTLTDTNQDGCHYEAYCLSGDNCISCADYEKHGNTVNNL